MAQSDNERPDPDALLAQVTAAEKKSARGKLKVFFGASAGVGKTYAMLEEARGAIPEVAGDAAILVAPEAEAIADGLRAALEPATAARLREAGPARAAQYTPRGEGRAAWAAAREAAA